MLSSELLALLVSLLSSDGLAPSDLDWLTIRSSGLAPSELSELRLGQLKYNFQPCIPLGIQPSKTWIKKYENIEVAI